MGLNEPHAGHPAGASPVPGGAHANGNDACGRTPDRLVFERPNSPKDFVGADVSDDGRWLYLWTASGAMGNRLWIADLRSATSPDLAPGHPEKVLLVTESFTKRRSSEHRLLLAALQEACAYCELPEHRDAIADLLSADRFVATSPEALRRSLSGPFAYGDGRTCEAAGLHIFSGDRCNEPSGEKLRWLLHGLQSTEIVPAGTLPELSESARWFRSDLYRDARSFAAATTIHPNAS
ncbi:MAG: hypothetical protein RLZZ253_2489 [Verrucomicrobiota bacterium]